MATVGNLETHLAALISLRGVCERLEQRLARANATSGPTDGGAMDEALREVCAQIYERLGRIETALQRTEGIVADKPWDLSTIAYRRLERVEEALQLTQKTLEDSTLPEMCVNIERQLIEARMSIQRTEKVVTDESVRQLCEDIDARLGRTEDRLRLAEGIVAGWLQQLSATLTGRFAEAEDTIHRIERIVSSRTVEHTSPQQPDVPPASRPHVTIDGSRPALAGVLARAEVLLRRLRSLAQTNYRAVRLPWTPGLTVPVVLCVTAVTIGVLIWTSRGAETESAASLTSTDQIAARVAPSAARNAGPSLAESVAAPPSAPPNNTRAATVPSANARRVVAATQRSPSREPAPFADRAQTFVGTLSIRSVPSGALVSINGKAAGVTPLRLARQRAGSLAVQIAQDGFERWSAAVRVPADQLTEVNARLRPIPQ